MLTFGRFAPRSCPVCYPVRWSARHRPAPPSPVSLGQVRRTSAHLLASTSGAAPRARNVRLGFPRITSQGASHARATLAAWAGPRSEPYFSAWCLARARGGFAACPPLHCAPRAFRTCCETCETHGAPRARSGQEPRHQHPAPPLIGSFALAMCSGPNPLIPKRRPAHPGFVRP